jgi:hypothetical protein
MSATRLPDGSVVMRPSGQRAVNPRGGAPKAVPCCYEGTWSRREWQAGRREDAAARSCRNACECIPVRTLVRDKAGRG